MSVYERFGVRPLLNAVGDITRMAGTPMLPEVCEAMNEATRSFVNVPELQEAAGRTIAEVTGAESGYVTSGAAAGLVLAAAACIARDDAVLMNQLPDTNGRPHDILVQACHRDAYDRCFRSAGGRIVSVGQPDGCSAAELEASIGPSTVAVGWFSTHEQCGLKLPEVCAIAHRHDIPVIVDASMALPPVDNLWRFTREGADLVAFSGGKALRGPQAAGILAGRADLIRSVASQHMDMAANPWLRDARSPADLADYGPPGHGIGRPMKVGKEEIVGVLVALEAYPKRDHAAELAKWQADLRMLVDELDGIPGVNTTYVFPLPSGRPLPIVRISIDAAVAGCSAIEVDASLQAGTPRICVGSFMAPQGILTVSAHCLRDGEPAIVARRLREALSNVAVVA